MPKCECDVCGEIYEAEKAEEINICPKCIEEYDDGSWPDLKYTSYADWFREEEMD